MKNFQQLEASNLFQLLSDNLPRNPVVKIFFSLVPYILISLAFLLCIYLLRKLFALKLTLDEKQILLEITPPQFIGKEAYTTEQLFSLIHALGKQRSLKDKLLGKKVHFSLEIVSTRIEGIRFIKEKHKFELKDVKKFYQDKKASQKFIDHCINVSEFCVKLMLIQRTSDKEHPLLTTDPREIYSQ